MPVNRPHVALIIETSKAFGRGLLRGISKYVRAHGPWSIYVDERAVGEAPPTWLSDWEGHGVIVRAQSRELATAVCKLRVPVVDTLRQFDDLGLPAIYTNDAAISESAAAHLISKGFRNFAFVGVEGAYWSDLRCAAFEAAVRREGLQCDIYEPISRRRFRKSWEGGQDDLCEWMQALPKPVGIMAAHDLRALCVLDACRRTGTAVPEHAAIVGVDNDELLCDLADPPLSSVPHDLDRMGHESAALLARIMNGESAPRVPSFVEPFSIVSRQSTDIVAIEDPVVASAMRFIREHACNGIRIEDVVTHTGWSRRVLERAFERHVGISPHAQIVRMQMERIKQLLAETDLSIESIAKRGGFAYPAYLCVAFKKHTGQTPNEYRRAKQEQLPAVASKEPQRRTTTRRNGRSRTRAT
jgi:LacI family transcriptional regulator